VNLDEDRSQALKLLDKVPVTFPILFDPDNLTSESYGVDAMPTTVLIDRNGVVRHHHRGYKDGYMDKYEDQVKALVLE
ncbi:MAG: TlpA disulfide reductase family protein, partial [Pseudomonadota bacterium]|nr:TlpA disulfide reductase family protein [Pseudomonadota bacterium]